MTFLQAHDAGQKIEKYLIWPQFLDDLGQQNYSMNEMTEIRWFQDLDEGLHISKEATKLVPD